MSYPCLSLFLDQCLSHSSHSSWFIHVAPGCSYQKIRTVSPMQPHTMGNCPESRPDPSQATVFMQIPSEPWLTPKEAHISSAVYWQNFGSEHISNASHWALAALKKHRKLFWEAQWLCDTLQGEADGFPSQTLCPEQMTAFPWMCPKSGEGQLICSTNGGNVFSGQGPLHGAGCFVPSSSSLGFKMLVYSKRNAVHVFLIHLHLNH